MNGESFPPAAKEFLQLFYNFKNARTDVEKIAALKDGWNLQNAIFYCAEEDGLRTLEFYILTKVGMI